MERIRERKNWTAKAGVSIRFFTLKTRISPWIGENGVIREKRKGKYLRNALMR